MLRVLVYISIYPIKSILYIVIPSSDNINLYESLLNTFFPFSVDLELTFVENQKCQQNPSFDTLTFIYFNGNEQLFYCALKRIISFCLLQDKYV